VFHIVKGDVRNVEDIREAIRGVDVVFHLAAVVNVSLSVENPLLVNDVNVRGTLNLLGEGLRENVQRFIYVSTCAVYGEARCLPINEEHPMMPTSPYGISKFAAEHYCKIFHRIHGLETGCLRLFNVYGPRQSESPYSGVITQFVGRLRQGKPPVVYGDGEQTRDFVYVQDVVDACMLVMGCERCVSEVINVGTGKPTTVNELAEVLIGLFKESTVKPEYAPPRAGEIQHSYADISKAERILGYKPKFTLRQGLRMFLKN